MSSIYDFSVKTIDGREQPLAEFRGQALLVVNVASRCGFTPQYTGLEAMYRRHHEEGFTILGFPCDQFLHQEPGDETEIKNFCSLKYDVTFPLFAKVNVNGPRTAPLYQYLKAARRGLFWTQAIKWNFTKFLIDRAGNVLSRYAPRVTPEQIEADVQRALSAGK
jgi:glutathione peroxidase